MKKYYHQPREMEKNKGLNLLACLLPCFLHSKELEQVAVPVVVVVQNPASGINTEKSKGSQDHHFYSAAAAAARKLSHYRFSSFYTATGSFVF